MAGHRLSNAGKGMARIRTLKPEFWEDETVASLSARARLLFIASWNFADDEGILRWTPEYIKSNVFMYDVVSLRAVAACMQELVDADLIFPYRGGRSQQPLALVIRFRKHQRIDRPQPGHLPGPSLHNWECRMMYARRDNWICQICGDEIVKPDVPPECDFGSNSTEKLSLDHIMPRSHGGLDAPSNIRATHDRCNKGRGDRVEWANDSANDSTSSTNDSPNEAANDSLLEGRGMERKGNGKEGKGGGEARARARPAGLLDHPAVTAYFRRFVLIPPISAQELIAREIKDLATWNETLNFWHQSRYRPESVPRMIEKYHESSGQKKPGVAAALEVGAAPDWKKNDEAKARAEYEKQKQEWESSDG